MAKQSPDKIKLLVMVPGYQPFYTHTTGKHLRKNLAICLGLNPDTQTKYIVDYGFRDDFPKLPNDMTVPFIRPFFTGPSGYNCVNILNKILIDLKENEIEGELWESQLWQNQDINPLIAVTREIDEDDATVTELHQGTLVLEITEEELYKVDRTWNKKIQHWASFSQWEDKGKQHLWEAYDFKEKEVEVWSEDEEEEEE